MSVLSRQISDMPPIKLAYAARELRSRLAFVDAEPIAIIGMGCRFPGGGDTPEDFWDLLRQGRDATADMPPDRWDVDAHYDPDPDAPGKMYVRRGGFLESVDRFDAGFFGITPREAAGMDPQQRLLLEVAWEALENANQAPDKLFGRPVGVFVGVSTFDYALIRSGLQAPKRIDAYYTSGHVLSVAAGRLSYTLGLTGPSVSVDTACSSSLTAVHLACRSLRGRESDMALVGGVGLLLAPEPFISFCKAGMLAPDGRCKTFDADADGYVRGEGCGVIVLKRMSDAVADGDGILALIRGSAVNQDGASAGLTAPSGPSQEQVIRRALESGGVNPDQVSYVEAHGTGTSLGDPIEMGALKSVFGGRSRSEPLVVGSVKTNIGHLEAASGAAGLIKVVLSLRHGEIPPHLHFKKPNPHIAWESLPVEIPTRARPWPARGGRRIAGVSAFGFSGTNAHVVLEAGDMPLRELSSKALDPAPHGRPLHMLALSAKTGPALDQLAERYEQRLADPALAVRAGDICFSANTGRSRFSHRLAVVAETTDELYEKLVDHRAGRQTPGVMRGQGREASEIAFLFTGQGAQYVGMGRRLYETQPVFQRVLDRCDEIYRPLLETPLLHVLYPPVGGERQTSPGLLDETVYTQPALFALECALAELWKSWGVEPALVLGHSVGEYAAAHVAGVFSLEDGAALIATRARLMGQLPHGGEMAAVFADEARVADLIEPYEKKICIAGINGPGLIVISGKREAMGAARAEFKREGVNTQRLNVSHAFHSSLMEPMLSEFENAAKKVRYAPPRIGLISNVTGNLIGEEVADAAYWVRHVRLPVRFAEGIAAMHRSGCRAFVEVGPAPVLSGMGKQCLKDSGLLWIPSLRRGREDWAEMLRGLAELYVRGAPVDWSGFDREYSPRGVVLPTYPFQRERFWVDTTPAQSRPISAPGSRLHLPFSNEIRFASKFSPREPSHIKDHKLFGTLVVSGASHIAMAIQAARGALGANSCAVEGMHFQEALVIPDQGERTVQLILTPGSDGRFAFKLVSARIGDEERDGAWSCHVEGTFLSPSTPPDTEESLPRLETFKAGSRFRKGQEIYSEIRKSGHFLGPSFQWIDGVWQRGDEGLCRMRMPAAAGQRDSVGDYPLHPGLIDSCFQFFCTQGPRLSFDQGAADAIARDAVFVPFTIGGLRFYGLPGPGRVLWCHTRIKRHDAQNTSITGDIRLFEEGGRRILEFTDFTARRLDREVLMRGSRKTATPDLYEIQWRPAPHHPGAVKGDPRPGPWLILSDRGGAGPALAQLLEEKGETCKLVAPDEVNLKAPECFHQLFETGADSSPYRGVVFLWGLDVEPEPGSSDLGAYRICSGLVRLVQAVARNGRSEFPPLWLVTRGAQPVGPDATALNVHQAPLWGMGAVIPLEHADLRCVCLDLDPSGEGNEIQTLLGEILAPDAEDRIAWRRAVRYAARLTTYAHPDSRISPESMKGIEFRGDRTYLITGGLGALGLQIARWMTDRGVRSLALVGRSGASDAARGTIRELERAGARVLVISADVSDREAAVRMMAQIQAPFPPLGGVIHAAGVLSDAFLVRQDLDRLKKVMAPKVDGAWNMHELTREFPLDFFVCFSSAASLTGAPGQGAYAAANAFMDALAHHRRALGLPGLSINWGPWSGAGMAAGLSEREQARWSERGMGAIAPEQGLAVLGRLMERAPARIGVLPIDWSRFAAWLDGDVRPRWLETLLPAPRTTGGTPRLMGRLKEAAPEDRCFLLMDHVRAQIAEIIGAGSSDVIDPKQGLFNSGMDSLMAVELKSRLERDLGRALRSTLVFDYPTVEAVVDYLMSECKIAELHAPSKPDKPDKTAALPFARHEAQTQTDVLQSTEPIAIIGLGCRFPGGADSPETLWRLLYEGVDAVAEVPPDRWDMDAFYDPDPNAPGKIYSRHGGFLDRVDMFDADFFGISPREAVSLDPQQRLLLEVSWEALEHANLPPGQLSGSRSGVFVGISTFDYAALHFGARDPSKINAYFATGNTLCMAAGRLSYTLGLTGPSMAVDTACSSSLVSIHLACQSLRNRECDMALAGGVGLILSPALSINFSRAKMLSPEGRCKTFDASADGYVRAEGCGVIVLKRLSDALAEGDHILSLIRGSAVNQDGPSAGFTVPSGRSQQQVIRQALANAGVSPDQVSYVEAHGTGTPLGDPIEMGSLGAVFGNEPRENPLLVGSIKTNMGHLEAAAGVAGIIKTVLALQHGRIPPHLHFHTPNPQIDWDAFPVKVPTEPCSWPLEKRVAGVSSFGASGTNAHIVLEAGNSQFSEDDAGAGLQTMGDSSQQLLTLSAKTEKALRKSAARWAEHLMHHQDAPAQDICFTAAAGRTHFNHRLSVIDSTTVGLSRKLNAFSEGRETENVFSGALPVIDDLKPQNRITGNWPAIVELGKSYVAGASVDWTGFYKDRKARWTRLPTYPFQRERFWIEMPEPRGSYQNRQDGFDTELNAHPLLGRRLQLAGTREIIYECRMNLRSNAFLADHIFHGTVIFPVAACIEMAVAAGSDLFRTDHIVLTEIVVRKALIFSEDESKILQFALAPPSIEQGADPIAGKASFRLFSRSDQNGTSSWTLHISGTVAAEESPSVLDKVDLRILQERCDEALSGEACYRRFQARGIDLGPAFQVIDHLWRGKNEALCRIRTPEKLESEMRDYRLHPVLFDACIQTTGGVLPDDNDKTYMPVSIDLMRVDLSSPVLRRRDWSGLWSHIRMHPSENDGQVIKNDLLLFDGEGAAGVQVEGLSVRKAPREIVLRELEQGTDAISRDWTYEVAWRPAPRGEMQRSPNDSGLKSWLILADREGLGPRVAELLKARGEQCVLVFAREGLESASPESEAEDVYTVDPANLSDFEKILKQIAANGPIGGVVHLWSLDQDDSPLSGIHANLQSILHLVQALVRQRLPESPGLWIVTQGAQPVASAISAINQSPVWGLGPVITLEHPNLSCALMDLDPSEGRDANSMTWARMVFEELWSPDGEKRIAFRNGLRHTARLVKRESSISTPETGPIRPDAGYLITGGLGALGLQTAKWLADEGARWVALMGRNDPSEAAREEIGRLESAGVAIRVIRGDVSDKGEVADALKQIQTSMPPLGGVLHAAGVLDDGVLLGQDMARFRNVLAPKILGAWNLHILTRDLALDFFVCFSSAASLLGSIGQGAYAAANAFMDALAHYRRGMGLTGLSINWGPWAGAGMSAAIQARNREPLEDRAIKALPAGQAFDTLKRLLQEDAIQAAVLPIDWPRYLKRFYRGAPPFYFAELSQPSDAGKTRQTPFIKQLAAAAVEDRRFLLETLVRRQVAEILDVTSPEQIEVRQRLFDAGLDSLMAEEITNGLEQSLGYPFPSTLLFDYPTVESIVAYLVKDVIDPAFFPEETLDKPVGDPLEDASEDEIADLLARELAAMDPGKGK